MDRIHTARRENRDRKEGKVSTFYLNWKSDNTSRLINYLYPIPGVTTKNAIQNTTEKLKNTMIYSRTLDESIWNSISVQVILDKSKHYR